jgi:hypothetical protein
MTRYYGVLASHHRLRERAIPKPAAQSPTPTPSPNPPRRPRSPCASSSWTGPVVPLTARPFGRFVTLALPLALDRAKIPRPRTPAAPRASPYSSSPPNSYFKTLKRTHTHPDPRVLQPGGERADVEVEGDVAIH